MYQLALENSPNIHALWFDLSLAFLASGWGALADEIYHKGCSKADETEVPRRRGLYYIAIFDLVEHARQAAAALPAEAAQIYADLRRRLAGAGQDLSPMSWLPEALAVAPPLKTEDVANQLTADALSLTGEKRRIRFRERLQAANLQIRDPRWHAVLLTNANESSWPAWAVQCLTFPEKLGNVYVYWRPLADLLAQLLGVPSCGSPCGGEVCVFDDIPQSLQQPVARVSEILEERRKEFPYASDRACTLDAVELLGEIGGQVAVSAGRDPVRALETFQMRQLEKYGLRASTSG
jgi:hypothetical protein